MINIALTWSGWRDSNPRPPDPKAGALTKLRHIPPNAEVYLLTRRHRRLPTDNPVRPRALEPSSYRPYANTLGRTVRYTVAARPPRGRSSMAEPQPSKLVMRVRFPSPAPTQESQVTGS